MAIKLPEELQDRYRPLRTLGTGSMGVVVLAEDVARGDRVAIKLINDQATGRDAEARFAREVEALQRLDHPGILEIRDSGYCAAGPYLVTEYLEGSTFDQLTLNRNPLPWFLQIAEGLEAVHEGGLLHRDLKPGNMMLLDDGRCVLIDFGLVLDPQRSRLTRSGAVGTVAYMAPEMVGVSISSEATDWYAWGASLFEMLEGRPPYTTPELHAAATGSPLPPLRFLRRVAGLGTQQLLQRTLARDPDARPRSVAEIEGLLYEGNQEEKDLIRKRRTQRGEPVDRPSESTLVPRPVTRPPRSRVPPPSSAEARDGTGLRPSPGTALLVLGAALVLWLLLGP